MNNGFEAHHALAAVSRSNYNNLRSPYREGRVSVTCSMSRCIRHLHEMMERGEGMGRVVTF
eukprot:11162265-Lingulodinium_polyedra.AAC.1